MRSRRRGPLFLKIFHHAPLLRGLFYRPRRNIPRSSPFYKHFFHREKVFSVESPFFKMVYCSLMEKEVATRGGLKLSGLWLAVAIGLFCLVPMLASAQEENSLVETVRREFKETPILFQIARCESGLAQLHPDGKVVYGGYKNAMVGLMQINTLVHTQRARLLGYDIETLNGNIGYAKYLYRHQGARTWKDSKHCWKNLVEDDDGVVDIFLSPLEYGMNSEAVRLLQKTLNTHGYAIASSGPGTIGKETTYFGGKTRQAVQAFQCDRHIVCSGEAGYGRVGTLTRKALNEVLEKNKNTATEIHSKRSDPTAGDLKETLSLLQKEADKLQRRLEKLLSLTN